ncbi:S8 family serine peptidase [Kribbella jejuensis]|uniref:Subtilase family protein n=1 Tax=Kribbella jejuensis TaxID=236068 RepID=A0A542E7V7_9ACTN|nr:S8 family serine peptidase [Kribbella jejuensis]TQJ11432.1 subtilase family protein [Kribbella jejuensis]
MVATPRSRRFGLAAVASVAALGLGLSAPGQASAGPQTPPAAKPKGSDRSITLITGDRVTLQGGDPARATIQPGKGRTHVAFSSYRQKDHLYVVPSDVRARLAEGRLDARLFDVTGLIKDGYDDAVPLIVTYKGRRAAVPGARQLPAINGAALAATKDSKVLDDAGIDKVWLDGKRQVTLDQSVPQIGAPTAWKAGYTGKGVPVAVLDTGIDKSHPDLATQVVGMKNFTDSPDGDHFGHGTHVASTIAGTAAASSGKYKGVAPDARLYDGKVCDDGGSCQDSAIVAGMEWAAKDVKAKIVNLSLGSTDTPEIDPLEEAVNRLTAETGTLFVIAAGNDGPGERTIGSPGSAESALTVGAVDKQNGLADFSSRGPRIGDGAVKPDISAPGVSIVAAKAQDSVIGEPVGDRYLRLDGTSMATPHVAGSAAILAQEHPTWKAAELKGALMGSAKPAADQTAFEQGAGRVDVAKGIKQTVIAEPGDLSFGTAVWPHGDDTPVTKTLTYRNLGDKAVTLKLAANLNAPDGAPAPAGALRLSATTVTVPAGGTASVQATSNTKHDGADGLYSGRITATGGDVSVTSGIGVEKEKESYNLTLKAIGVDGKPTAFDGVLLGLSQNLFQFIGDGSETLKLRLLKGEYLVQNSQFVEKSDGSVASYGLVQPSIQLTKDTTVVFDARTAKPVKVTVPQVGAKAALADVGFDRASADGAYGLSYAGLSFGFDDIYSAQVGSAVLPPAQLTGHVASQWAQQDAEGSFDNSPYLVGQANSFPGVFPTGFMRAVKPTEQAAVAQAVNATSDHPLQRIVQGVAPGMSGGWAIVLMYGKAPLTTTLYADAKPARWQTEVDEVVPSTDPNNPFPETLSTLLSPSTAYRAKPYRERFNAAAFTTAPGEAVRTGGDLYLSAYGHADADGNRGFIAADSQSSKLLHDGKVVAESPYFGYIEASGLPAAKTAYTLESTQTQSAGPSSTRMDLRWTFTSAATSTATRLPLLGIRFQPKVDDHNRAVRKPITVLPVVVDPQDGQQLPAIRKLTVQVSGDDGKTWHNAAAVPIGHGRYTAIFETPAGSSISVRSHLADGSGNQTDLTVVRAYQLR